MGAHEHYHDQHGGNALNTLTEPDRIGLFMHRRGIFGLLGVLVWVGIEIASKSKRRPGARPAFSRACLHAYDLHLSYTLFFILPFLLRARIEEFPLRQGIYESLSLS